MKKRIVNLILALTVTFTFGFSACIDFGNQSPSGLTHIYDQEIVEDKYLKSEATCTSKAKYYYSCFCGEIGSEYFEYGEIVACSNVNGVCEWCGKDIPATHGLKFQLINGASEYEVIGYIGDSLDVYIPSTYDDKPITSIGDRAFYRCEDLTSISIPDSITNIGEEAFYGCSSWESGITIPNGVKSIGDYAFGISSLDTYTYKDRLRYLGNSSNPYLYLADTTNSLEDPITTATIEDGCKFIGSGAFGGCWNLTSVTIPDSVTSIGSGAFGSCTSLKNITIPDGVTRIADSMFSFCLSLTSVQIPNGVTSIGNGAFRDCEDLASISIPDSVTSIGENVFFNCGVQYNKKDGLYYLGNSNNPYLYLETTINSATTDLKTATVEEGCKFIAPSAFAECHYLRNVTIPASVMSIGEGAFFDCWNLESITVDARNADYKDIDGNLYSKGGATLIQYAVGKTEESFTVPNVVTAIGAYAFYGNDLRTVTIPNGIMSIGREAFKGTAGETYGNCRYIGNETNPYLALVSARETYYSTYTVHEDTRLIADSAFSDCIYVDSITIPEGVTSIGNRAFYKCEDLTGMTVPDSVRSIGEEAFNECRFKEITLPFIGAMKDGIRNTHLGYVFGESLSLLEKVTVTSAMYIARDAFDGCSNLTSVVIDKGVMKIEKYAFSECKNLTSITFNDAANWYRVNEPTKWNHKSGGKSTDVTDSSANVTLFNSAYLHDYWYQL